jgi:hypothetical protein
MADEHRETNAPVAPRVAIISTSINAMPSAYTRWASQGDLIVAGDVNSDTKLRDFVDTIGGEYISPDEQEYWPFSDSIGWRTIQRRNVAIMVAYARRYDYVVTVDDDNHPCRDWVAQHVNHLQGHVPPNTVVVHGDNGWVDPGRFVVPAHHQRGVPYGVVRNHIVNATGPDEWSSLVVSTAQVLGDPDCDAVTRIAHRPQVSHVLYNAVVADDDWTAFNSQATVWDGRWAPLMACLPHVGRYDDIFASFIAKAIMRAQRKTVYVGEPSVTQRRNEHNVVDDLRAEYYGMNATPHLIRVLDDVDLLDKMSLVDAYGFCIDLLEWHDALPPETLRFMDLWRKSWLELEW